MFADDGGRRICICFFGDVEVNKLDGVSIPNEVVRSEVAVHQWFLQSVEIGQYQTALRSDVSQIFFCKSTVLGNDIAQVTATKSLHDDVDSAAIDEIIKTFDYVWVVQGF